MRLPGEEGHWQPNKMSSYVLGGSPGAVECLPSCERPSRWPGRHRLIFRVAAETGCRLGEALGLVWSDVDLERQTISFDHQLDRQGNGVPLQTARSRRVLEITPALCVELRRSLVSLGRIAPHALVFSTRQGTGHDHRNIGGRVLARAIKAAGLGAIKDREATLLPAPTFHALRHSHASALIAAGWDIAEVSARLRQADVGTAQRTYVHASDAARRSDERRDRLAALYRGGAMEGSTEAQTTADRRRLDPQTSRNPRICGLWGIQRSRSQRPGGFPKLEVAGSRPVRRFEKGGRAARAGEMRSRRATVCSSSLLV